MQASTRRSCGVRTVHCCSSAIRSGAHHWCEICKHKCTHIGSNQQRRVEAQQAYIESNIYEHDHGWARRLPSVGHARSGNNRKQRRHPQIPKQAVLYENFTVAKLGAELDIRKTDPTGTNYWNGDFTPTENLLTFDFAFWHHGDLDQSHSTTFPANLAAKAAKSGLNLSTKAVGTTTLDLVSRIEDGLVKVELTHDGLDIVGLQARIKYDTSKLVLKNVIYDTGNTVTNFSKPFEGELLFGGLSTDGKSTIKKGKAFTLEFTPIGTVNNVTGLFYFENTDAVKANGDKINLNIQ